MDVTDIQDLGEIVRVVVLMETHPLTDVYSQVILTQEEFKQVTGLMWKFFPTTKDDEMKCVTVDDKRFTLPDMQTTYSDEYVKKERANCDHPHHD